MATRSVSVTDSISRFVGMGALILSLGGGFYLYQDNQQLKTEVAKLSDVPNNPEGFQQFVKSWDEKLTNTLGEFEKQADGAVKEFDAAREARNRIFQAATEQTSGLSRSEVEELIKQQLAQLSLPEPAPELRVATSVMRPSSEATPPMPSIRNVGNVAAEIRAARFKPRKGSEFVVEGLPKAADDEHVVIEFGPEHNQGATIEGAHRFYERSYILPEQVVPKNKTVQVTIEIRANNRHLDWGMTGDLELEYQDGRTVLISNARAVFVPDPEATT